MNSSGKGNVRLYLFPRSYSYDGDSIKVFVRVRPLTQCSGLTTDGDPKLCLTVTSPNTIRLLSKPEPRTFTYDHVADMDTSQDSVFSSVAKNIVESCMNGYNGTIFAYGQTGSGKTFTMLGPSDLDNFTDELRGVIPRSFEYLFFLINREVEKSGQSKSFLCKCSFIEIYNEQIYDLLDTASACLFLRENIKKGLFVEGAVLSMGWRNRRVASTSMNRESSRSHAVFTMTLESKESLNEVVNIRMSQLNLVDLAGSERQKDTHTEGSRLKEASSINRSLMCLGQVIMALVDVSNGKNRHICYRDSKLTFLLRDSLGGNAKTYIIANVHPGVKCFGETLSTLQFAQRAKLIKNKAVINEDTQGNVRQLQAEVKKLKEQLAQAQTSQAVDCGRDVAPGGPVVPKAKFMASVRLWRKREEEKRVLLEKVSQLEEAWTQKDKFIHSSRMIIRFREDHICRLEKKLKTEQGSLSDNTSQSLIDEQNKEIQILRDQVEHHPKMARYAAENFSLRQENRQLRCLESVVKAEEVAVHVAAELEEAFQRALETEGPKETPATSSAPVPVDAVSAATIERLKAQLLQKQSNLTGALQAFEEYKEITNKQMSQLESEKRYLEKSNEHLENILEAKTAYKNKEVSELNRIHVETIKILTTPTQSYNLRARVVALSSPDHLNGTDNNAENIWTEQPPTDMTEIALTEELCQVQEQASRSQTQFNEEELKNSKLLQQITKLEVQIAVISQESDRKDELLSSERANRNRDHLNLQETVHELQQSLQSEQQAAEVLRSEIRDLRLVLQSSDTELAAVKNELRNGQSEKQREMSQFSYSLINTQLQLDKVLLEWEQLLEQHRTLQDSFDQLQAEAKFEADQARQQLQDSQQEIDELKAQLTELNNYLQTEQEHTRTLLFQLRENKETSVNNSLISYSFKCNCIVNDVVLDLINHTRDLRSELSQRDQTITHLSGDIIDITAKFNAACLERQDIQEQNFTMQAEICDLKETLDRRVLSNKIEVEVLQEEVVYATEEVERLTKVLDEQNSLLQASQEQTAQKDIMIQNLQQNQEAVEGSIRNGLFKTPCTPGSFKRDLTQVLESQEIELENRRSSMMTMEILLMELNAERAAKNDEIQRLKLQLTEKELVRIEIQTLLDQFYNKQSQLPQNGNHNGLSIFILQLSTALKDLTSYEERAEKVCICTEQDSMLARSQTCVQELTTELRNRCLELRDLSLRMQDEEKLLQENEVLRKQNVQLSEENGKLVGHKNHKQKIEYLVNLKRDNTKLQEYIHSSTAQSNRWGAM
uniref:Kinesin family member 15 n=1 Tax=Cyclopterus lumpus TaxID=8103 RepID=A0A8C2ZEK5_CYCLU